MFSAPVALRAGLSPTAVYLDAGVCLHVSSCPFVVAGGDYTCGHGCEFLRALLIEIFSPNHKNSRD